MNVELIMPIYFPLNPYQPSLYPSFFFLQAFIVFMLAIITAATDVLYCSLVCLTSMEFDIMGQKINQLDPENDENAERKLQDIINRYNELTDISNELEDIFSFLLLNNVFAGIFMLCVCVFFAFTSIRLSLIIKFIPALPDLIIQLFSTCFYGELLQTTSLRVADEAYNCIWYGQDLKFRKMILLTMLRTQQPQKLTGWNFMDIGLPVFYWILQTTHSYYSLLSGLYEA
ncbi:hypothetical protein PVAND_008060 [Polypedilum vanderplanki]|uniref:Odorant receptor n=1 Tax=Polypedilum vanderplanki TaxID=319348 RepID=A0A9J6C8B0_POLVA|nr:hypothetical protein PVAND_008060 [Polypedilum vanderplanki]